MASKSKVLVIGATGYIGKYIALARPAEGHPTFVLVRPSTLSSKAALLQSFQAAGITLLEGSLEDQGSLVAATKQVDVVISAVGGANTLDQLKIIDAIKEVGTIKVTLTGYTLWEPLKTTLEMKVQVRRAVEESGIPYTFVVSNGFAGFYLSNLLQQDLQGLPREKVSIYGSGDVKFICVSEDDIGAYTMKAVDDPRTLNKTLHIRPPGDVVSMNSLVEMWETMIGKTLEKVTVIEEDLVKQVQETPLPDNVLPAIIHGAVIEGALGNFELGPKDVEATTLYPDHKYTSAKEYLAKIDLGLKDVEATTLYPDHNYTSAKEYLAKHL